MAFYLLLPLPACHLVFSPGVEAEITRSPLSDQTDRAPILGNKTAQGANIRGNGPQFGGGNSHITTADMYQEASRSRALANHNDWSLF